MEFDKTPNREGRIPRDHPLRIADRLSRMLRNYDESGELFFNRMAVKDAIRILKRIGTEDIRDHIEISRSDLSYLPQYRDAKGIR